jgi:hypothetical protein
MSATALTVCCAGEPEDGEEPSYEKAARADRTEFLDAYEW